MEEVIISISIYSNLKLLHIVYDHEKKIEWLDMFKQVRYFNRGKSEFFMKLNFKSLLQLQRQLRFLNWLHWSASHCHYSGVVWQKRLMKRYESFFYYPSLRRIILSKKREQFLYPLYIRSSRKLVSHSVKLVYMSNDIQGQNCAHLQCKLGNEGIEKLYLLYNIRALDLNFIHWRVFMLQNLLASLPSLVQLKIKGCA